MKPDMRSTLVAVTCLFPLAARAAPSAKPPTSIEVLTRMVRAHRASGPATNTFAIVAMEEGKAIAASVSGVQQWNDASHSFTSARMRLKHMDLYRTRVYVNGKTEVTLDEMKGEYRRGRADDPSELTSITDGISRTLSKPTERARLAKVPVQPTVFNGQSAWRLSWLETDTPKGIHGPARVTVIVGRADSLMRKYTMIRRDGSGLSITTSIQRRRDPFPAETFVFSAPAGTKEATD